MSTAVLDSERVQSVRVARNVEFVTRRPFVADLLAGALAEVEISSDRQLLLVDGELAPSAPEMPIVIQTARAANAFIVSLFTSSDSLAVAAWVELGIHAFLGDDSPLSELVDVTRRLNSGETILGVSVREGLLSQLRRTRQERSDRAAAFLSLTRRESEVLRMLANGASPEDVARNSYVSLNTVRTQIRGVLAKLDVSSVVAAVAYAYQAGWMASELAASSECVE